MISYILEEPNRLLKKRTNQLKIRLLDKIEHRSGHQKDRVGKVRGHPRETERKALRAREVQTED